MNPSSAPATPAAAAAGEYLTFRLGDEEYGIDILRVQEIRSYEAPTRIANAPPFIKGVVNLRGVIVPIVDLRVKLGCEKTGIDAFTVVIVLSIGSRIVGVVVDAVSDVLHLSGEQIKPAPEIASSAIDTAHIRGIGSLSHEGRDRMLILLDIAQLMSSDEIGLIARPEPALA